MSKPVHVIQLDGDGVDRLAHELASLLSQNAAFRYSDDEWFDSHDGVSHFFGFLGIAVRDVAGGQLTHQHIASAAAAWAGFRGDKATWAMHNDTPFRKMYRWGEAVRHLYDAMAAVERLAHEVDADQRVTVDIDTMERIMRGAAEREVATSEVAP